MSAAVDEAREIGRHDQPIPEPERRPGMVTGADVAKLTGISYRQVNYWITHYADQLGITDPHPGSGYPLWVPASQLPEFHVIAGLREQGIALWRIMQMDHQQRLRLLGQLRAQWRDIARPHSRAG